MARRRGGKFGGFVRRRHTELSGGVYRGRAGVRRGGGGGADGGYDALIGVRVKAAAGGQLRRADAQQAQQDRQYHVSPPAAAVISAHPHTPFQN